MKKPKKYSVLLCALLVLLSSLACNSGSIPFISTSTPYPTYTLYPTYTPPPATATPIPERWEVEVLSVIKSSSFGKWLFETPELGEFIIVTVQYTYRGESATEFYPASAALLFPAGSTWPGWIYRVTAYQPEDSSEVLEVNDSLLPIKFIRPGQTKIEKFGFGYPAFDDTELLFLFQESAPIPITIPR